MFPELIILIVRMHFVHLPRFSIYLLSIVTRLIVRILRCCVWTFNFTFTRVAELWFVRAGVLRTAICVPTKRRNTKLCCGKPLKPTRHDEVVAPENSHSQMIPT